MIDPHSIPSDITDAAIKVSTYMQMRGYRNWELAGLCDRSFARASSTEMRQLIDGAYDIVETWQVEGPGQALWRDDWLNRARECGANPS